MLLKNFIFSKTYNFETDDFIKYDKQFFVLTYDIKFVENTSGQIERLTKFYLLNYDDNLNKEIKFKSKIKTGLYKNFIALIDLSDKERAQQLRTINELNFYEVRTPIKNNKESIINYQKLNCDEYLLRDLTKFLINIKEEQDKILIDNHKWQKSRLKTADNLNNCLNELRPRQKEIFIYKMKQSQSDILLNEHLKMFIKWTKDNDNLTIKKAILYYLNRDEEKGLNINVFDIDSYLKTESRKWQIKLYYRDLYLKLFDKYIKETNGDKAKAKWLTMKEIETNKKNKKADY